jgi:hypothetical protein
MNAPATNAELDAPWLHLVRQQVDSLDYGVVQIIIHGRRVVQIEKTEKVRLDKTDSSLLPKGGEGGAGPREA